MSEVDTKEFRERILAFQQFHESTGKALGGSLGGALSKAPTPEFLLVDELKILVAKHKARRRAGKVATSSDYEKAEALGKAMSELTRWADQAGETCHDIEYLKGDLGEYVAEELRKQGLQCSVFHDGLRVRFSWAGE